MDDPTTYTIRLTNGQTYGPAELALVEQWAREGRIPDDAMLVPADGSEPRSVHTEPELASVLRAVAAAPPMSPQVLLPAGPVEDGMSGLIPYRNPTALVGYYMGIGSLIPIIALVLGPVAIILGILGYRRYRREPQCKGVAHAWIAIVIGSLTSLVHYGFIIVGVVASIIEAS